MAILLTISALLSLMAVSLLVGCVRHTRHGRLGKASSRFAGGAVAASLGGVGLLAGGSYYGYERLTAEMLAVVGAEGSPIAAVSRAEQRWVATATVGLQRR